jgi:predicted nucleic acid-binding protein
MKLFLGTNILFDITANREPFSKWAIKIFKDSKKGKWKLYTSSASILTTHYIIEKQIGSNQAKRILKILLNRPEVQDITKRKLLTALTTNFKDYEDSVQHECAKRCKRVDYIITRNKKDFKNSIITVMSPEELYFDSISETNQP